MTEVVTMQGERSGLDVESIRKSIVGFVCEELKLSPEAVSGSASLRELPGAESVKMLRIIARIERKFNVELDDEVVFRVESLDELVRAVFQLMSELRRNDEQ